MAKLSDRDAMLGWTSLSCETSRHDRCFRGPGTDTSMFAPVCICSCHQLPPPPPVRPIVVNEDTFTYGWSERG